MAKATAKKVLKVASLDPLDVSFAKWQNYNDEIRYPHYKETFGTDPTHWKRHSPDQWAFQLNWSEFRYADVPDRKALRKHIKSKIPGIYIFYIRPTEVFYRFPQYALYAGISNEGGSKRALIDRLYDYLPNAVEKKVKRDNIDRMLRMYYGVLWVAFAFSNQKSKELERLETNLHGYIYPRYDKRDWPVDIKTQHKRFGQI